jgi:hypothetical protein
MSAGAKGRDIRLSPRRTAAGAALGTEAMLFAKV